MIPKIIHYCWFGGGELPEKDKKCIESWKKFCPDYEIVKWDETNYDLTKNKYMLDAYQNKKWGFVPDYARLDIVYTYGGIYMDTDVEIIKSMDDLLKVPFYCGFEAGEKNKLEVNLGLGFGAEKGNPIIRELRDYYNDVNFVNKDGNLNLIASPYHTTLVLKRHGLEKENVLQKHDGFIVFPTEYFSPKSYIDGVIRNTDKTYTVHHFNGSWKSSEDIERYAFQQKFTRIFGYQIGWKLGAIIYNYKVYGFLDATKRMVIKQINKYKDK